MGAERDQTENEFRQQGNTQGWYKVTCSCCVVCSTQGEAGMIDWGHSCYSIIKKPIKKCFFCNDGTSLKRRANLVFRDWKVRNCNNAGNVAVCSTDETERHSNGIPTPTLRSVSQLALDITATLTSSNPRCHFIVHEKSPVEYDAVWFLLDCSSVGSDAIYQFDLWEHLPIVYPLITVFDWQHTEVRGQRVSQSPSLDTTG